MQTSNKDFTKIIFGKETPPRFTMTPEEVHLIRKDTDIPDGLYDCLFGLLSLYHVETENIEARVNAVFMLTDAFIAGCAYNAGRGGAEL